MNLDNLNEREQNLLMAGGVAHFRMKGWRSLAMWSLLGNLVQAVVSWL